MKLTRDQINTVCAQLSGSCESMDSVLSQFNVTEDDLDSEDLLAIDEQLFLCDGCGWWLEVDEMADDDTGQYCVDCKETE